MTRPEPLFILAAANVLGAFAVTLTAEWVRPGTYFGVRVPPEYRNSPEALRSRRNFRRKIWAGAAAAIALSFFELPLFGAVIQLGSAIVAFRDAWRETRPHGVEAPTERVAQLFVPRTRVPVGPFILLAAVCVCLLAKWDSIPERFPVHWDFAGRANGWSTRTPAGVFWPLLLAFGILVFLAAVRRVLPRRGVLGVMTLSMWIVAIMFSLAALTPLILRNGQFPLPPFVIVLIPIGGAAASIWLVARAGADQPDDYTPNECWKWGQIYYNPDDPSVWIEKRIGLGYTFNFARWQSWALLGGFLALPVAIILIAS